MNGLLLLTGMVLLSSATTLTAQSAEVYTATVVTRDGHRTRGLLKEANETDVIIGDYMDAPSGLDDIVALSDIRKVVLRRTSQRRATVRGAVAGGIVVGLLTVESSQRDGFRSPVVYGITLASALVGAPWRGTVSDRCSGRPFGPIPATHPMKLTGICAVNLNPIPSCISKPFLTASIRNLNHDR